MNSAMSRPLLLAAPVIFLLLWSAGFAIAKIGLLHAGPFTLLALRYSIAVLVLLPLIPLFTLGVYIHEQRFGARHFRAFQEVFGWPALPSGRPSTLGAASVGEAA